MRIPLVTGRELCDYLDAHTKRSAPSSKFREVTEPLRVFKKVRVDAYYYGRGYAIANLIIPKGAFIYAGDTVGSMDRHDRKMRASEAKVHSIVGLDRKRLDRACSSFAPTFVYRVGDVVRPVYGFSWEADQCESGIHFYLNLGDALNHC
jgi:hypothetical protein